MPEQISTERARQGVLLHRMRYVLGIGMVIVLFAAIYFHYSG